MTHQSHPDLLVLHALRLKGFAEPPAVAEATGVEETDVVDGAAHHPVHPADEVQEGGVAVGAGAVGARGGPPRH